MKTISYPSQTLLEVEITQRYTRTFDTMLLQEVLETMEGGHVEHKARFLYELTIYEIPPWFTDVYDVLYPFTSSSLHGEDALTEIQSTRPADSDAESDGEMEF